MSEDRKEGGAGVAEKAAIAERLASQQGVRQASHYLDGRSLGLEPTRPLDLDQCKSYSDLLAQMRATAFGGRQLGEAADVLEEMVRDERCLVIGTFSGAMTVAKQGLVLCDMIDHGMLDVVISTGALMAHGLIEATGMRHFKVPTDMNDRSMYYAGFDRVYDTLELEKNLDDLNVIFDEILTDVPAGSIECSRSLCERLGRHLAARFEGRGILKSAVQHDVPVYVPAFTDSELGLDFALFNQRQRAAGKAPLGFDPFLDLEHYTQKVLAAERIGIFTIGGGVPRNWAQQVCPFIDLMSSRAGQGAKVHRFRYAVRICPEPVHWGGMSGCTYSEGVSWGKFIPPSDGGRFAEVPADATIAWPLLVAGVRERLAQRPSG